MASPQTSRNHPRYYGLTDIVFKDKLYKFGNSFRYETKRHSTELYTYFMGKQEKQRVKVSLQWYIKVKTEL